MMKPSVSILVPAWNEEARIGMTLEALHRMRDGSNRLLWKELIVIDDGSCDRTGACASRWATRVIRHDRRRGKGAALQTGWKHASGDILLFADADLGESAIHLSGLLELVLDGQSDMAIAHFADSSLNGGFGIVKRLAGQGIFRLTGLRFASPLSGQRAVRASLLRDVGKLSPGFGIEVGLTIDAARLGFRICEVPLPLRHRETGRTWSGFLHRGLQMAAICRAMLARWRGSVP